ncbi:quinone oxidoreductase family protein [Alkalihalobacillus pseudalcaliphilus]|uniref:quinone oxidoreductase family protein n=1 Tax=Alkalihalobacillus pseudalcaliphilus TaxID=79884 RepID=UPI00064E0126|nr:zinc-binding dehydrogenase [Alkalihalobacillus pseudalcaliphilus]KMK76647.1 quinone oxidoreductase [Alkalihalobacillus pseudalcaliphilus]
MKAIVINQLGGPEVMIYQEVPMPKYEADEVLIRVLKTSVNFADVKNRRGQKSKGNFPLILGLDLVGVIEEVGEEVKDLEVGQRVIAFPKSGSYAEYAVAHELLTYPIPANISMETAAASPIVSFLSYQLLHSVGGLQQGESVLIHSGAGGVGTTAIRMAKYLGAKQIFATVGHESKMEKALQVGADAVFTYDNFTEKIITKTEGEGVNLVLDSVAGNVTARSVACLSLYGRLVHFGNSSGEVGEVKTKDVHASCRSFLGYSLGTTRKHKPELLKKISGHVIKLLQSKAIEVEIGHQFYLQEMSEAHKLIEERRHQGKIIIHVND